MSSLLLLGAFPSRSPLDCLKGLCVQPRSSRSTCCCFKLHRRRVLLLELLIEAHCNIPGLGSLHAMLLQLLIGRQGLPGGQQKFLLLPTAPPSCCLLFPTAQSALLSRWLIHLPGSSCCLLLLVCCLVSQRLL